MAIKILTDTAADIMPNEAEKLDVELIPLTIIWDEKEYRDAFDMNHETFFEKLQNSDTLPTTSQITPAAFAESYEAAMEDGDQLIVITLSSMLSGTYQNACTAAESFQGRVFVVDSLSATVGQRLLVEAAVQYRAEGLSAVAIVERLIEDRHKVRILARLDTLKYLKKGGRISPAVAFAGEMLSVKPVITVRDGAIELMGKARGSKNANNLLRKFVQEAGGIDFSRLYYLLYSGLSDDLLKQYINDSADMLKEADSEIPIVSLGAVIGTHIGPGAIGVVFFEKSGK